MIVTNRRNVIVQTRIRDIVAEYLRLATNPEAVLENLLRIIREFENAEDLVIAPLAEALDHPHSLARVFAAWNLVSCFSERPNLLDTELAGRAVALLETALLKGNREERWLASSLLAYGKILPSTVSLIPRLLKDADSIVRINAAVGFTSIDLNDIKNDPNLNNTSVQELLKILRDGLDSGTDNIASTAAMGLAQLGVRDGQAIHHLIAAINRVDIKHKRGVFLWLGELSTRAKTAAPALAAFIKNKKHLVSLRGYAVKTLIQVTAGSEEYLPVILQAMRRGRAELVYGGAEGFESVNRFPEAVVDTFAELLLYRRRNVRMAAATGLAKSGKQAVRALPQLVECAQREANYEVIEVLAEACAAVGPTILPKLLDTMRNHNVRTVWVLGLAVRRMGQAGRRRLAKALTTEADVWIQQMILVVLREVGLPSAEDSIPVDSLLDNELDDEVCAYILMTIESSGAAAMAALPKLILFLATCSEPLIPYVERAILAGGLDAIPALQKAAEGSTGKEKERLEKILKTASRNTGIDTSQFGEFDFGRDDWIQTFVWIGNLLGGELASLKKIASELQKKQQAGELHRDAPISNQTLSKRIEELEKKWQCKLFIYNRKLKQTELTSQGKEKLIIANKYIQYKLALRKKVDN